MENKDTPQLPLEQLRQIRIEKLKELKKLGVDAYPSDSYKNIDNADVIKNFEKLENEEVTVAGRINSIRKHGKLMFIDIYDASGNVQIYIKADELTEANHENSELKYDELHLLDESDFIEVTGKVVRTKSGEISVEAKRLRILAKSLRSIPKKLKDKETRFRRRYVDTNVNRDVYERFIRRTLFWKAHRDFFDEHGFIEMAIPVLEHIPGGGDAIPFVTHMNAIDEDLYLRISHELPLKRLIGAGYEKIYDIGPRFRNEGLSDEHLPEHYAMEFYWAYANWNEGMKLVEDLFNYIIDKVYGGKKEFEIRGFKVNFSNGWEIIDFAEIMREKYGIKDIYHVSLEKVKSALQKNNIEFDGHLNVPRGVDSLWKNVRKEIAGPAFLVNHPKYLSPLQKPSKESPDLVERFQPIVAGSELGNGWSEVNDPLDQFNRFMEQQKLRDQGDEEAQFLDIDYVEMLEYGMPPTFGYGHSERVFWFLEDVSAREGVPFPQLKFEISDTTKKIYGLQDYNREVISGSDVKDDGEIQTADSGREESGNGGSDAKSEPNSTKITKEKALEILHEHMQNTNLRRHSYAVGYAMGAIYDYLKEKGMLDASAPDRETWEVLGILHDSDYEITKDDWDNHTKLTLEWLKEEGVDETHPLYLGIMSHNNKRTGLREPQTQMEWALETCDELTGFIVAVALVKPEKKLEAVDLKSVKKKWGQKSFAKGVEREQIEQCEIELNIPLDDFIEIVLKAMQEHSDELGL